MQSVVQLMAEKSLYEFWKGGYKVHSIDWSEDKAKKILETWQRKFIDVCKLSMYNICFSIY